MHKNGSPTAIEWLRIVFRSERERTNTNSIGIRVYTFTVRSTAYRHAEP